MTKFENRGVELQYGAASRLDANNLYRHSCNVCCHRGLRIDCARCAIHTAHELAIAAFDTLESNS